MVAWTHIAHREPTMKLDGTHEIPALRETIDVTAARHTPVVLAQPTKPKPKRSKVNASVPADLIDRFEQAANIAGVGVAASLEDALTQWIERNTTAESSEHPKMFDLPSYSDYDYSDYDRWLSAFAEASARLDALETAVTDIRHLCESGGISNGEILEVLDRQGV
jgi:hypothetical protein